MPAETGRAMSMPWTKAARTELSSSGERSFCATATPPKTLWRTAAAAAPDRPDEVEVGEVAGADHAAEDRDAERSTDLR